MCVVSMIGDHFNDKWKNLPWNDHNQPIQPTNITNIHHISPTRQEFDALKKDVEEMKELLKRAKAYDEQTNQADCEMEEKILLLKKVADLVGVDLTEVFKK